MPEENKNLRLKIENVSKVFAKVESDQVTHALQDVSVEMSGGEFVSLVGPSGCGKSTILRLVAGLITPTLGRVTVNGEEISGPSPSRGLVFQNPTLFPWLTAEKNISFSLDLRGDDKGKAEKVEHMLDEPLGALDEFTRMNMQDEILNIWMQKKQLALMVTHSIDEAVYMGTRVLVMEANPGRIVADIRIDEDFPRDRSSASFVEYRNEILNRLHFGGKHEK